MTENRAIPAPPDLDAQAELYAVGVLSEAMQHDWRAAVAYLERGRLEHTGRDGQSVSVDLPERVAQAAHVFLRAVRDHGG